MSGKWYPLIGNCNNYCQRYNAKYIVRKITSVSSRLLGSVVCGCFSVAWASHLVAGLKINPTFRKAEKLALTNSESRVRHEQKSIAN